MRIGLTSIFAFRPHVEHMMYLADLLKSQGHEVSFFSCDTAADTCYNKLLKGQGLLKGCGSCVLGGMHSYPNSSPHFSASRDFFQSLSDDRAKDISRSSSYTLHRVESPKDLEDPEVLATQDHLRLSIEIIYGSAKEWIRRDNLEGVLLFNGRMDLTRAVIEACRDSNCLYSTVERPWLGHGLQFNPGENCIGLKDPLQIVHEFRDRPLTARQAELAGRILGLRFAKRNVLEWRQFNTDAIAESWPKLGDGPKILFTPGSRSESVGHPDFADPFQDDVTLTVDRILQRLGCSHKQLVMRSHPIWSQKIGRRDGMRAKEYFENWARRRDVHLFPSDAKVDTYSLMRQADIVIMTGGSTGVEAASLGKKVICINPTIYTGAGFTLDVAKESDLSHVPMWQDLVISDPIRQVLRFTYSFAYRYPQFVNFVRATTPLSYKYRVGADAQRIIDLLRSKKIEAGDSTFAESADAETSVVKQLKCQEWEQLVSIEEDTFGDLYAMERRFGMRWIDQVRDMFPRGDRWS